MSIAKGSPSDDSYVDLSATSSQSGANGVVLRPLTIASPAGLEVQVPVPSAPFDAWIAADVLREEFQRSLAASPEQNDVLEVKEELDQAGLVQKAREAQISLSAKFLGFLASRVSAKSSQHELNVLHYSWIHFHNDILSEHSSVHDLIATLDTDLRTPILRSFYEAFVQLEKVSKVKPALTTPKLFGLSAHGKAQIHAVFGGQGNNEVSISPSVAALLVKCVTRYSASSARLMPAKFPRREMLLLPHAMRPFSRNFWHFRFLGASASLRKPAFRQLDPDVLYR